MFSSQNSQVSNDAVFVEDIFSTYLYTGNGSTQTITNGIDLAGKGGLVWAKMRSNGSATGNVLFDTARGASQKLETNTTGASSNWTPYGVSAFGSTGFTVADDGAGNYVTNNSGVNYASWTFRKQPKFFDVVTFTGTQNYGGSGQTVSHSLGSTPGCIIIKPLSDTSGSGFTLNNWIVYHRGLSSPTTQHLKLNSTASIDGNSDKIKAVSDTTFTAGWEVGLNGIQYVAYIFAHNAGGFGLTGTDNVISCGSYTGNGSTNGPSITLGYEPQWLLVKSASTGGAGYNWVMIDNMRGFPVGSNDALLRANLSDAEVTSVDIASPTATGFNITTSDGGVNGSGQTYIYIAIRRGPMKVPTSGTSVFAPVTWTGTGSTQQITTGFFPDMFIGINRGAVHARTYATDILRGLGVTLPTNLTEAENSESGNTFNMTGYSNNNGNLNSTFGGGQTYVGEFFKRAPSFFDEVCYTGDGASTRTLSHNLAVAPEWIILRKRNSSGYWFTYFNFGSTSCAIAQLEDTGAASTSDYSGLFSKMGGAPTSSSFFVTNPAFGETNLSGTTYVAYLFATCSGVSKVGSYTGTGTTLQVNCGFTGGARFVLIKRTDSTGDWYVWDSARGIVSGNDPYLLLNSTSAETTGTDYIDTYSAGFEISSTAPAAINASGGTYIFLAIA